MKAGKDTVKKPDSAERKRLKKKVYEKELSALQIELARLQRWIKHSGLKVVVLFEGRDAAGKGGDHQADYRVPQPAHMQSGRPRQANRTRGHAVVLPALRRPSSGRR